MVKKQFILSTPTVRLYLQETSLCWSGLGGGRHSRDDVGRHETQMPTSSGGRGLRQTEDRLKHEPVQGSLPLEDLVLAGMCYAPGSLARQERRSQAQPMSSKTCLESEHTAVDLSRVSAYAFGGSKRNLLDHWQQNVFFFSHLSCSITFSKQDSKHQKLVSLPKPARRDDHV